MPDRPSRTPLLVVAAALAGLLPGCQTMTTRPEPPQAPAPAAPIAFDDAVTIGNGRVKLGVSPGVGRIVHFGPADGPNLIWLASPSVYDEPVTDRPGQAYYNLGGDKLWPLPQPLWKRAFGVGGWPPDGVIDGQPWTLVESTDRRIVIESRVSPALGVRARRTIELAENEPRVTITNSLTRVEASPFPVHLWTVTQTVSPRVVLLDVSADRPASTPTWLPMISPHEATRRVSVLGDGRAVAVDLSDDGSVKVGTFGRWIAGVYDDLIFLQTTPYDPTGAYPDASSLQTYSDANYTELELLSELAHLQPGESLSNRVTWQLVGRPETASLEQVRRLIEEIVGPPIVTLDR